MKARAVLALALQSFRALCFTNCLYFHATAFAHFL